MPKDKTVYVCDYCGQESVRWVGKCPSCGRWNTMKEMTIRADEHSDIRLIQIIGLASIEGNSAHNQQLSDDRAAAMRDYVIREVDGITPDMFETIGGGEAWTEFRDQLNDALLAGGAGTSLTTEQLRKAIDIIDKEPNLDLRERKLRQMDRGRAYKAMVKDFLADQRNSGYLRIYYSKK